MLTVVARCLPFVTILPHVHNYTIMIKPDNVVAQLVFSPPILSVDIRQLWSVSVAKEFPDKNLS